MNAIAKAIVQNLELEGRFTSVGVFLSNLRIFVLIVMVIVSALALIYVKDLNRRLFIDSQNLQQVNSEMNIYYGRLLLEQGVWSAQERIQVVATNSLNMVIPSSSDIVMLSNYGNQFS